MSAINLFFAILAIVSMFSPVGISSDTHKEKAEKPGVRNLAIFVFDGVQIIDYTGPYEVFGQAYDLNARQHYFNVYTVAEKEGPIVTAMGMTVVPKYTFANCPKPDVVVLPGGGVRPHLESAAVLEWVRATEKDAEYVLSVCNGAFFLGKAGLLDGLTATTFYRLIDDLKALAPKCTVVSDQRFVDNGKIITTAGLSSGMDGALHVIERIAGRGKAQEVALNLEYNWQPDANYARASFADKHLRKALGRTGFDLPEGTNWKTLGQEGDTNWWLKRWEIEATLPAADLAKLVDAKLAESWSRAETAKTAGALATSWRFVDEAGKPWRATSSVAAPNAKVLHLTIQLMRDDGAGDRSKKS